MPPNTEAQQRLAFAQEAGTPCAPVRDLLGSSDISAAYAVQQAMVEAAHSAGRRTVGRKIGLTNPKVQAQLGVDQPDFGVLLDGMECPQGETIDIRRLLQPRIEAEVAFVLDHDLDGDGEITVEDVRRAVAYACPALEIVDSRVSGWDITIVDTIADNASSGLYVLGEACLNLDEFDPVAVTMSMRKGEVVVSSGTGAQCLGDPLAAVVWLATTVRNFGSPLRAGEVVLSGALGPMVSVEPGTTFEAELEGLGSVTATFSTSDWRAP
jgi:2-keto-4-pentenoate hydratase